MNKVLGDKTMTVYIYKEYNDRQAYGEELIQVFSTQKDATDTLKKSVEEHYGILFKEIPSNANIFNKEEDSFSDTYVSINEGNGVCFWAVEEKPIIHGVA